MTPTQAAQDLARVAAVRRDTPSSNSPDLALYFETNGRRVPLVRCNDRCIVAKEPQAGTDVGCVVVRLDGVDVPCSPQRIRWAGTVGTVEGEAELGSGRQAVAGKTAEEARAADARRHRGKLGE